MLTIYSLRFLQTAASFFTLVTACLSQEPPVQPPQPAQAGDQRTPGPGGPGGFPGPMREEIKLVEKFDKDGNKWLNRDERKAAREFLAKERAEGRLRRGPGMMRMIRRPGGPENAPAPNSPNPGPGTNPPLPAAPGAGAPPNPAGAEPPFPPFGRRENQPPPQPGRKLTAADVEAYPAATFYDPNTFRTLFFEFENEDWEKEMADFHGTDVEVPARLNIDGKTYSDVGVHFRGASSFMMIGEGRKRSLGVSMDLVNSKQDVRGYQTLDLLNSNDDPSFLRAVLYYQIAREYIPAPKANFVRVVINGESWGVYVNKQQFNKDFLKEWFGTGKGARWKVPGSPGGGGGLEYLGDDLSKYKARYELKSKDEPKAWASLMNLCRVLNETPADQLEEKLKPILNIDGALRFLALDNALVNNDGYWTRASDYSMYEDESGKFHLIPHDANETFAVSGGPGVGGRGGPGRVFFNGPPPAGAPADAAAQLPPAPSQDPGPQPVIRELPRQNPVKGVELDPLVALKDTRKPLLSKLLAVPSLRERYLGYVKDVAEKWLDWERLGPIAKQHQAIIAEEVRLDTRKLDSTEAFEKSLEGAPKPDEAQRERRRGIALKAFAEQRRAYLLNHPEVKGAPAVTKKTAGR